MYTEVLSCILPHLFFSSKEPEVAAQALCFLIAQLGNPYPPLKGSAYMKVRANTLGMAIDSKGDRLIPSNNDTISPFIPFLDIIWIELLLSLSRDIALNQL